MPDLLERAFNQLAQNQVQEEERERKRRRQEAKALAKLDEPVLQPAEEAIKAILKADQNKDYFELLQLPAPGVDALGRPVCACTPADISKAYRRLSVRVHPDKNPGEDARQAFEALNKAHRLLQQQGPLEEALKHSLQEARRKQDAAEAAATPEERVVLYAAKKDQAKQLSRQQAATLQAEMMRQQQQRLRRTQQKRDLKSTYRKDDSEEQAPALLADGAADSSKQSESDIFVPPSKGKKRSFL